MNTVQIRGNLNYANIDNVSYQSNPLQQEQFNNNPVIEGFFPKENSRKEMAIRKVNTTLCILLGLLIMATSISYYFATANEMTLNELSRQTTLLNDENAELQFKLEKLKSFNNVDMTMQKNSTLSKAKQVIEVPAIATVSVSDNKVDTKKPFAWAIGY